MHWSNLETATTVSNIDNDPFLFDRAAQAVRLSLRMPAGARQKTLADSLQLLIETNVPDRAHWAKRVDWTAIAEVYAGRFAAAN